MAIPTETEVLAEISRIAREELEVTQPLRGEDGLAAALGLDSLRLTILAVGLENRFRVRLEDEDTSAVNTVAELAELVVRRAAAC